MSAEPYFNSQNDLRMFGKRLQEKDDEFHQERERAGEYKQNLEAALCLLAEYTNLPYAAETGNSAYGKDEGISKMNDILRDLGASVEDCNIFDKLKIEKKQAEQNKETADAWMNTAKSLRQEQDKLLDIIHDAGVTLYWMLETPYNKKIRQKAFTIEKRINNVIKEKDYENSAQNR